MFSTCRARLLQVLRISLSASSPLLLSAGQCDSFSCQMKDVQTEAGGAATPGLLLQGFMYSTMVLKASP